MNPIIEDLRRNNAQLRDEVTSLKGLANMTKQIADAHLANEIKFKAERDKLAEALRAIIYAPSPVMSDANYVLASKALESIK